MSFPEDNRGQIYLDEPYCEHDASITEILSDDVIQLTCSSCGKTQEQLVEWID